MRKRRQWRDQVLVVLVAVVVTGSTMVSAQDAEVGSETPPSNEESADVARHQFDLGLQRLDTPAKDTITNLLGYTTTFLGDMSFSAGVSVSYSTSFLDIGDGNSTGRHIGLGDTVLIYSFVPGQKITANPWVPKTIGFSVLLVVPTGSAEDLLGGDQFVITPQAGWVIHLGKTFSMLPAIGYTTTFAGGELAIPAHQLFAELGLVWAHPTGWWVTYSPELVWDLEEDDWKINDTFSVGKMFGSRFGLSLAYGVLDRVDPNATRDDFKWALLFHWVLKNRDSK